MTTRRPVLRIRGLRVEVVRKNIKNLHLGVYPPHGRVRVAAPLRTSNDALRLAVVTRFGWIMRQRRTFAEQSRESKREMISGESHLVAGRRYRLRVIEDAPRKEILLRGHVMEMRLRRGSSSAERATLLQRWYRQRLRAQLPALIAKWAPRVGAAPFEIRVRRMRTRWGSCSDAARRIWLNVELAKKPLGCLEYVLVHELVHLVERRHTPRFKEIMDSVLPDWQVRRTLLNRMPLGYSDWQY